MKINKGDTFLCKENVIMNDDCGEETAYIIGKKYVVDSDDNRIKVNIPSELYRKHAWDIDDPDFNYHFKLVTEVKDPINKAWHEKFARPIPTIDPIPTEIKTPEYYDNSKGSLYKFATARNWNAYLFDVVKRLERGGKKDPLKQEIEKSIAVLELWLKEL